MTNKQAQITINSIKFMLDHAQYSDDVEEALNMAISALTAKPEQSIAQERYEDLCEYFKDCSDQGRSVLNDRKEFKSWLDRIKWHVMECDKLGRELEKLKTAQPEQRWIPCSERIPEEYGEYLISWTTSQSKRQFIEICECEVTSEYDYEHERFECEWLLDDYITNYPDVTVIAWMPLPEPYKEGTDD